MEERTLIREDENGTRYYWVKSTCRKCGGKGVLSMYMHIDGGVCYDCDGRGIEEYEEKEYSDEYLAKLEERARKRAQKKLEKEREHAAEKNAEFLKKQGFNEEGKTYFVLGNTFDIKEELKAQGAKWDNLSRHWHMATKPEGRETLEVDVNEMYYMDAAGVYDWRHQRGFDQVDEGVIHYAYRIEEAEKTLKAQASTSVHVGEVGQRISIRVTYIHTSSWENGYGGYWNEGVTNLHTFKDAEGNVFVWKTSNFIEADYGTEMTITGTVKEHSEYNGIKQTVLTRCKLS